MSYPDEYKHENLGAFRRVFEQGWIGHCNDGALACDLFIEERRDHYDDPPNLHAIATLADVVGRLGAMKPQMVEAICMSRQVALNWRPGPPVDCWSLIEVRIDLHGVAWLNLHEYETDEYSRWLVRLNNALSPAEVRRIPALPLQAYPAEAGVCLWESEE